MKKNIIACVLVVFLCFNQVSAGAQGMVQVYPGNWWTGMHMHKIQLLIHSRVALGPHASITINYPGITLTRIHRFENPRYAAADLDITGDARPGIAAITIRDSGSVEKINWPLQEKRKGNGISFAQGITSADLIYLIMPDRFSNGDPGNDKFSNLNDTSCDRNNPFLRHGGDLQGITRHLDYFNELGVTALWLTPVVENDQPLTHEGGQWRSAYHGYAFTNQYQVDPRLGGNQAYIRMIDSAHAHHLKVIQDAVYNHVGDHHFLFLDPPSKDWFNQWPTYTQTLYRDQPLVDEYASKKDYDRTVNGWFTRFMPDLNQDNPYVANFLIEYAIWAVEEYGIDGWRVDTYFYSDRDFLNNINTALTREYPHITVFGETTMHSVTEQAYYAQNNINTSWKSNLQGVIDYEWFGSALAALNEPFGDRSGVMRLYNTLVQDILYKDPMRNEIFLDNHDQNRFYSIVGEDFNKYKMGIALLLTQRGIPQLYYGTEILMKNFMNPSDAEVRKDFPGGWPSDSLNKFTQAGRTPLENEAFEYVKTLAHFRMHSPALQTGKLMQYIPRDGLYVYFRYDAGQTIMCVMNTSDKSQSLDFKDYAERTSGFSTAMEVTSGKTMGTNFTIPPKTFWVLLLHK